MEKHQKKKQLRKKPVAKKKATTKKSEVIMPGTMKKDKKGMAYGHGGGLKKINIKPIWVVVL